MATIFAHSEQDYLTFLRDQLPEYSLRDAAVPEPGLGAASTIYIVLVNQSLALYGGAAAPIHPAMPRTLAITGDASGQGRMNDLKHFVKKRNKIMKFLAEDPQAKKGDYVLKSYTLWNNFEVGVRSTTESDVKFTELAALRSAMAKLADPRSQDWFALRRFFHITTPEQKKAMVVDLLDRAPAIYTLDNTKEFKKDSFFVKYRDPSRAPNFSFELHSYRALHKEVTGYENNISGYMEQKLQGLAQRIGAKHQLDAKIAEQLARLRSELAPQDQIYAQHDTLQRKFVESHKRIIENKTSAIHNAGKALRQAAFGSHVRTHPARTLRLVIGHLVAGASAIKEKIDAIKTPPVPKEVLEQTLDEVKDLAKTGGATLAGVAMAAAAEKLGDGTPSPQWLTDLGWGTSAIDQDKEAWIKIDEHLNSMGKWEERMKIALKSVAEGKNPDGKPVNCSNVDEVLRSHAKMLFHLKGVKTDFSQQLDFFEAMLADLTTAGTLLATQESDVKRLAIEYEARENEAYKLLESAELEYYSAMAQEKQLAASLERGILDETAMPADVDIVSQFVESN